MNKILLGILFLLLGSCSHKTGPDSSNEPSLSLADIDLQAQKKVLGNGLTLIVSENKKLPIFSIYLYYKVGSKDEPQGMTGSSHFLEHMMFKGAKKYGEGEFDKIIEGNGGNNNAYTNNDLTVYYENLPVSAFDQILDVEADRIQNLLLEKNSFEKEKQVILEERRFRYENSPQGQLSTLAFKKFFEGTMYGETVIGKIEDIQSVSREAMQKYFRKYYAPNNLVMVIVGDLESQKVFTAVEEKFGKIPSSPELDQAPSPAPVQFHSKMPQSVAMKGDAPDPIFILAFQGLPAGHPDSEYLDLLSSLLGQGRSSYLSRHFVTQKKPILSSISAYNYNLKHGGIFFISGNLLPGQSLPSLEKNLMKKLLTSCEEAIDERSLQKVKNQYLVDMFSSLDSNEGVAQLFGQSEAFGFGYENYKKQLAIYEKANTQDIKKVCTEYINPNKSMFFSLWKKNSLTFDL